mmetsp:Transcript_28730/g.51955  ORF Transcript_28730/g.51955 Transcript_28730/m.51955 type:complete len:667 (-) Transcript_28730:30-2030(-)
MVRFAHFLIGVVSWGVADSFHLPSSQVTCDAHAQRNRYALPTLSKKFEQNNKLVISLSIADDDAGLTEEIESLDTDLALEIKEALSLAQDALDVAVEVSPDEEDIDEIANMLMEKPRIAPPTFPAPPEEDPPASIVSLSLEEGADENVQPPPPESPPPAPAEDFGETLQKKAGEEMERLKNLVFGIKEELVETEADTEEAEDAAAALKKEIEESMQEREAMMKRIESEFASEKELLVAQMGIASDELKVVMDQSAQNITEAKSKATRAEKELISRIDSFKTAIDEVAAEAIEINSDKERIQLSKQSMLDKVIQEGKNKLVQFKKSFDFDIGYAKQTNADLVRKTDEAESKVRGVYDQINQMRTERVSLQQQIVDVEKDALEEIETLQRELALDDERYATTLQNERDRLDTVIDEAYQDYGIKVCKKISERQAVEADYKEKVRTMNSQIRAGKEKQEARVKEYLDKLEEKHKKERVAIYQEKFEAVSAVRKRMNEELAIEYDKIEETRKTMRAKIDAVLKETAQMKAEFEKEMAKKRQLAKGEEDDLLREIEDVRVDMTDKMKTQRRLYEEQKATYLEDMNVQISESEVELRQKWRDLAGIKKSYNEVSAKRDHMIDDVVEKQALIDSYEGDRKSFRKSLRLTMRVAREKIGSKTGRLLKRGKEKAP